MKKVLGGFLVILLSACGGDSTSAPVPDRVAISPNTAILNAVGETRQYTARVIDSQGDEMVGVPVNWATSDPQVASISSSGLAAALKSGTTSVRATAEGLTGSGNLIVDLVPREMVKVSGDAQTGVINENLPLNPTVEVRDLNGHPIEGADVTFAVLSGGGTVSLGLVQTGPDGRASSAWRLGCSNQSPQSLEAYVASVNVTFTATADLSQLVICDQILPRGRSTLSYSAQLVAAGGGVGDLTWGLQPGGGNLPPGVSLNPDGSLSGAPGQDGTFSFLARVDNGLGAWDSAPFSLKVCEAPLFLPLGGSRVFSAATLDDCGLFLPAGVNGDRYRLGVVYASSTPDSADVASVTVSMEKKAGAGSAESEGATDLHPPSPFRTPTSPLSAAQAVSVQNDLDAAAATEAFHHRLRIAERELFRRLGPRTPPSSRPQRTQTRGIASGRGSPSPRTRTGKTGVPPPRGGVHVL